MRVQGEVVHVCNKGMYKVMFARGCAKGRGCMHGCGCTWLLLCLCECANICKHMHVSVQGASSSCTCSFAHCCMQGLHTRVYKCARLYLHTLFCCTLVQVYGCVSIDGGTCMRMLVFPHSFAHVWVCCSVQEGICTWVCECMQMRV